MKKQNISTENYLEKIPNREVKMYSFDNEGIVTLEIENRGIANRIAQKLLKKPKT